MSMDFTFWMSSNTELGASVLIYVHKYTVYKDAKSYTKTVLAYIPDSLRGFRDNAKRIEKTKHKVQKF